MGFYAGQTITIDSGANQETAVVASLRADAAARRGAAITVAAPLKSGARSRRTDLRHGNHAHRRVDQGA